MIFCYSNKFYSEKFKKVIIGAYGKKIVPSIYIFDVKLQGSYYFILPLVGMLDDNMWVDHSDVTASARK